jgi:hypothetical protein
MSLQWTRSGVSFYLNVFKIAETKEIAMNVAACYLCYLAISIAITVWVARTLHKNGRVFLLDAFHGNADLADSVNHLLVVGFYLINVGYIAVALKATEPMTNLREAIELESLKIGVVMLILGAMHFFNIFVFAKMRRRGTTGIQPPPYTA